MRSFCLKGPDDVQVAEEPYPTTTMKMRSKVRAIDKIYKRRDRYEIPEWQRQKVWSRPKKQKLIDSILHGWKLPKFYFLKISSDPETYEVVDGQQRLVTIFDFFDGALPLSLSAAEEFGGASYRDLPDEQSDAFDDYEIEFDEIEEATEEEVKDFFRRLQAGLQLTGSEKLNSVHSKLRDYVAELSKHPFFGKTTISNRRYGHFDIVSKVAAIEIDGLEVGLRYDDMCAVFESQVAFSPSSNVGKRLRAALDFVDNGFNDEMGRLLRNRTGVQSLLTLTCQLIQSRNIGGQEKQIAALFIDFLKELNKQVKLGQKATDIDYLEFQRTINANIKVGARIRQRILLRKFLAHDPGFIDLLDPDAIAESGIRKEIGASADRLVELIGQLNEQHSAQYGKDLFKATNRTVRAQANLSKTIEGFEDYKSFIDDLYFLFRESVGSRLSGRVPPSFEDVNTLRTGLQHDVDHGKKTKVKAKKMKIGRVFGKYAGVPSPAGLAPDHFVLVQANLLDALKQGLQQTRM